MTEVWFYHLERARLEQVLPGLLEKTLARGKRALVRAGSPERVEALDTLLWTYRDESFLPHGAEQDMAARQPIFLTCGGDNPNGAEFLFLVDGAEAEDLSGFERCLTIFDGRDDEATAQARNFWKRVRDQGLDASYWRQTKTGKWEKQS
ncbi:MAG: DNA polymerase III subunit chi [Parvularculaceae bacterium]